MNPEPIIPNKTRGVMLVHRGLYMGHYVRRVYHVQQNNGSYQVQVALIDECRDPANMVIGQVLLDPDDLCMSYVLGDSEKERKEQDDRQKKAIDELVREARKTRAR
jgi:hypothetical protein